MKLIEDLGKLDTGLIDKRHGTKVFRNFGLFECPFCLNHFKVRMDRGLKQNSCTKCKGNLKVTHGHSKQKYYFVWQAMIQRCTNPNNSKYSIYGGKGITVYDKWKTFKGFWEDNEQFYKEGLTIDRIDSSKGYYPDNIRWISLKQNSSETSKRRPVIQLRQELLPIKQMVEIKQWDSAKQAADELGLIANAITAVCSDNPKNVKNKTHGGFGWKYA